MPMSMPILAFANLITALVEGRGPGTIISLLIAAVLETNKAVETSSDKIDRILKEPFESGLALVEDARLATTRIYREKCLSDARLKFITAVSLEPTRIMTIRALFSAGVCADLLDESGVALHDYETSYERCLTLEQTLWERRNGRPPSPEWLEKTSTNVVCTNYSRLSMFKLMVAGLASSTWTSKMIERMGGHPTQQLADLYPLMNQISDVLRARRSQRAKLVAASELRVTNLPRGTNLALRRLDLLCPRDSLWWKTQ